jgi:hypothetical protein
VEQNNHFSRWTPPPPLSPLPWLGLLQSLCQYLSPRITFQDKPWLWEGAGHLGDWSLTLILQPGLIASLFFIFWTCQGPGCAGFILYFLDLQPK